MSSERILLSTRVSSISPSSASDSVSVLAGFVGIILPG